MAGLHPAGLEQELDRVASCQLNLLNKHVWLRRSCFQGWASRMTAGVAFLSQSPYNIQGGGMLQRAPMSEVTRGAG